MFLGDSFNQTLHTFSFTYSRLKRIFAAENKLEALNSIFINYEKNAVPHLPIEKALSTPR